MAPTSPCVSDSSTFPAKRRLALPGARGPPCPLPATARGRIMPPMSALDGFAPVSRRRWMRGTLAVGGALLAATGGGLFALRGHAPFVSGLSVLSDHQHRTLTSLALALFPPGGAFAFGADRLDLARAFDTFLTGEPEHNVRDLSRALTWFELGPVLYDRRARTFSRLDEAARLAHFGQWASSDDPTRRQVALALRKFLSLVFYDTPEVWPSIGYDGPRFRKGTP